ncbi:MAG: hypothetical protein WCI22_14850, partial [Actinomycetota bacterium]
MSDFPPPPPNFSPPPGYVAYGGPGAVGGFQRIANISRWLVIVLGATLAVQAAAVIIQLTLRGPANDFLAKTISEQQLKDKVTLYTNVSLVAAAIGVASTVMLCIWTFRMAKNMQVLGRTPQTFSAPAVTIAVNILGACTLGILNFLMWREVWRGSDGSTAAGDPSWRSKAFSPLIGIHLGLSIAGVVIGGIVGINSGLTSVKRSTTAD